MQKFNNVPVKKLVQKVDLKSYIGLNKKLVLLLPYAVIAALFIIAPMIMLLVKATNPAEGNTQTQTNSVLEDPTVWGMMGRSVYLGLAAACLSLLLAFPFAYTVSRSKSRPFKLVSITLLVSPLLIFTIAKVFALKILLIKMYDQPSDIRNHGVMLVGMVYLYMPFMIIPLYSVLAQMPESLLEASKDLGFNRVSSIIRVAIPYSLKAIFSGLAVVFMLSATSLVIAGTLVGTGGKPSSIDLSLIGNKMDSLATNMRQNTLAASQGSLIAVVTIAIMMAVYGGIYIIPAI